MKFKFVKEVEGKVRSYPGKTGKARMIKTGDEIELEGHFANKAAKNPDYSLIDTSEPKKAKNGNKGRS